MTIQNLQVGEITTPAQAKQIATAQATAIGNEIVRRLATGSYVRVPY
ncbi:MAG: hypothetical protein M5R40_06615 [Anaerolineae bacterium]|nr:hypothetical protein [Anaerolineae bacterium]